MTRFFDDENMDFATRCVLSGVRHAMSEVGETLATLEQVTDGDAISWLEAFVGLGRRLRVVADRAASDGHDYSAWNAALRSANYLYAGLWWAPATDRAGEYIALWSEHRHSWDLAVDHWPTPVERTELLAGGHRLEGHWFTSPVGGTRPAPAVVLVQGLGTPISDVTMTGLDGALGRGHHVLVLDGPGQGSALHRNGLLLDHTWPDVLDDAIAWVVRRPEVDHTRVTLMGTGHGALFATQYAARAARADRADRADRNGRPGRPGRPGPAALVLDPGVVDLGAEATSSFEAAEDERSRRLLCTTTTTPTGTTDIHAAIDALGAHVLTPEQLGGVACPTLVVTADRAWGFDGQSRTVLAALTCPHHHVSLRAADGAGADNGIDASQVHDAAVYDWLDATLDHRSPPTSTETRGSATSSMPTPRGTP